MSRPLRCEEIREVLPAYVRDGEQTLAVRRHLSRCADCKTELGRYVGLVSALGDLESYVSEPPPGLAAALARIPGDARRLEGVRDHVIRNRAAYLSGAAVALGATGAVLWRARRQRLAPA